MADNLNRDVLSFASHFQQASGIFLMLADTASRSVWNAAPFCESCETARCDCSSTHLALSAEAIRSGDGVYLCPIRLAFLAAPLYMGEKRLAFIAGPFIPDKQIPSASEDVGERLQKRIEPLPRLSPQRAIALGEILALCARGMISVHPPEREPVQTARADTINKIKEYVSANYSKKLTLDDIARRVFLSSSYISGIFRAETGKTLSSYINEVRIEKSKALLCETPLSLLDIALLCGFEDQSYFSKVFKTIEGVAPKDYRAQSLRLGWPES